MTVTTSSPATAADAFALQVRGLEKVFGSKDAVTHALNGITFDIRKGEFVGIMGPSGSGKSTLLNCISTIDKPTAGDALVAGKDITRLRGGALARFRREELGFVFQDANLLDTLTARENIALALTLQGHKASEIDKAVSDMAARLGVSEVLNKFPNQMSGGQRQRVAAARAFVGKPSLVLADEPTGALDSHSSTTLLETLSSMNAMHGATIMMVTHDPFAASWCQRILFMKDGKLFSQIERGDTDRNQFFDRIMSVMSYLAEQAGDHHVA